MSRYSEQQRNLLLNHFNRYVLHNPFIPLNKTPTCKPPFLKQAEFLMCPALEALYGGAAGPGKTVGMLMAALMYVEVPGYAALILRKSYNDLSQPGCPIPLSQEWLNGTGAHYSATKFMWTFPSGATLSFGYLQNEMDKYHFQGSAYQMVGWDELTQHTISSYLYLFSRCRKPENLPIPLRIRATSNPGNIGHEWVKDRFLDNPEDRVFIPAKIDDNPYIDKESYIKNLQYLDPITRRQLLNGDWTARVSGGKFRREWFAIVHDYPRGSRLVRGWDLAGTKPMKGKDPDYTVGILMAENQGIYYVLDMKRMRGTPEEVERFIRQTAELDPPETEIFMEREPGSAGLGVISHYQRDVLKGYAFHESRTTGDKELRANPMSSASEAGNVKLLMGAWIPTFLEELEGFPNGAHDDICLVADTLILTKEGLKPIQEITTKDQVKTRNGFFAVSWSGCTGIKQTYTLSLKNGMALQGTGNHLVMVKGNLYKQLNAISIVDEVCTLKTYPLMESCIIDTQIVSDAPTESITNITSSGRNPQCISTTQYGSSIMGEKFQKEATFTTSTETHSTMNLQTYNSKKAENILPIICENISYPRRIEQNPLKTSITSDHSQRYGTPPLRDENGIKNIVLKPHQNGLNAHLNVKNVEKSSRRKSIETLDSVHTYAEIDTEKEQHSYLKPVQSVEKYTSLDSTQTEVVALENVAVSCIQTPSSEDGLKRVYNLKVAGPPEYFANGILVHNCDSASLSFKHLSMKPGFILF